MLKKKKKFKKREGVSLFSFSFLSLHADNQTDNVSLLGLYPQSMHCKLPLKFKRVLGWGRQIHF